MINEEQQELEKKALEQCMYSKSLFGKDGAFAPMPVKANRQSLFYTCANCFR